MMYRAPKRRPGTYQGLSQSWHRKMRPLRRWVRTELPKVLETWVALHRSTVAAAWNFLHTAGGPLASLSHYIQHRDE